MGHYDCDECGNFDCICKHVSQHNIAITYHYDDRRGMNNYSYCNVFVSKFWINKKIYEKYHGYHKIKGDIIEHFQKLIFKNPNDIFKEIL